MNCASTQLMLNIKRFIYLVVLFGFSVVYAGSYDDFFLAIKRDDSGTIINLLTRGFDPNTLNPAGESGLLLAVKEPSIKVAEVLINWPKTDVEQRNKQDESPLMMAAFKGLLEISQKLPEMPTSTRRDGRHCITLPHTGTSKSSLCFWTSTPTLTPSHQTAVRRS